FSRVLYIDRDDFREDPPKGYHRLSPGAEVRLRYAYIVRCDEVVRDESGEIVELRCSYDPATRGGRAGGRNIRGTIQWVSAEHSLPCEVRLYDRLFSVPDPDEAEGDYRDYLNPDSLIVKREARVEPSVGEDAPGSRYQFERLGYFFSDPIDSRPGALVFNRTVTLRDTWARTREEQERKELEAAARQEAERREEKARKRREERTETGERAERRAAVVPEPRDPALQARQERFISEFALTAEEAEILTREAAIADLFEGAVAAGATSRGAANWLIHELPREARGTPTAELPVTAAAL